MLGKYLQEIGLNEKESAIYLALLQVDSASVADIAEKTEIKRPTVYVVLETLSKKGLVSEVEIGNKTHFAAQPPEHIETFIQQQRLKFDETAERLKDILPQLKAVQRESGERPVVKFFEGHDAAISANIDFFNAQDKEGMGYFIFNRDLIDEVFTPQEIAHIQKIRPQKHIKGESIYVYSKGELPSNEMTERKRVDAGKYPILCDISIYEDRVQLITLGNKVSSIFIQSKDVADTLKSLFKLAFEKL